MADISQLEVNGTTYDICDATARDSLSNYVLKIGDTMTGALTVEADDLELKSDNIDIDTTPAAQIIGDSKLQFLDRDGDVLGLLQIYQNANGGNVTGLYAYNKTANDENVQTQINLYAYPDGTHSYYINDQAAFRDAIGAVNKAGDTMTGDLILKSSNINRDGSNPSSNTTGNAVLRFYDKDDEYIGSMYSYRYTDGRQRVSIQAVNEKSDASQATNALSVIVAKDGTQTYEVSNQAAFRSAIGFGTDKAWTTLASGTDFYIKYCRYRNIVFVAADSRGGKTASSSGYTSLGTLPSGYRPGIEFWSGSGTLGSTNTFTVNVTTAGKVSINCSGSGGDFWSFMICFPVA